MTHIDVIDKFLEICRAFPARPAVATAGSQMTYGDFERRVHRLAHRFSHIEHPRVLIAVRDRAIAYAAMFGAGLAGGYYAPVNVDGAPSRMGHIVSSFEPDIIFTDEGLSEHFGSIAPYAEILTAEHVDREAMPDHDVRPRPRHELAYVIFTSGSTGVPKGVTISRKSLNAFVHWISAGVGITPADRVSQHANLAFDLSVFDIYGALCHGACLYPLVEEADRLMPARMIAREQITIWTSVPSAVTLMDRARDITTENLRSVRMFNFCGEPLLKGHVKSLFAANPQAIVRNTYGPTEATVLVTDLPMTAQTFSESDGESIALGTPINDTVLHLVNGPHADEGELALSGIQLAEGYWNDRKQTDEAFRVVDIDGKPKRLYFTGDWAERIGGQLYFKSRVDHQVKIRGFRVETDAIESKLRSLGWSNVCVFKHEGRLEAVVESTKHLRFDAAEIIEKLSTQLERYELPARISLIDHFPRNENQKIDRNELIGIFTRNRPVPSV